MNSESLVKSNMLIASWANRTEYKGHDRSKGSAYNSYRSILYTDKGKTIGFPEGWKDYACFMNDIQGEWQKGMIVTRLDTSLPHSSSNSRWSLKGQENISRMAKLSYNGESKTLVEWSSELNLNYQGVRQRFFRGKNLTANEILFGKTRKTRTKQDKDMLFRTSRMLGAYKLSDKKKGLSCDIDIENMRKLVRGTCTYCGHDERIGLDRIDNSIGHTASNVVPCCYECNCARNDNFTHEEMLVIGESIKTVRKNRKIEQALKAGKKVTLEIT